MTVDEFSAWLAKADPGDQVVYYTGELATDCEAGTTEAVRLADLRDAVQLARERGLVMLAQRRRNALSFNYIAVRRRAKR